MGRGARRNEVRARAFGEILDLLWRRHGEATRWYFDGSKRFVGHYREGSKTGEWFYFTRQGRLDAKRTELGVDDALKEIPGVTTAMLVTLGENGIKTVEDLAGCATDDLFGWSERKDGETTRYPGFLDGFELSRDEAEALIMQARVKAGWIKEEDLAPPPAEESAETVEATTAPA